ncbi:hypothetical protein C8J56DRAFT_1029922 [Mycena floridula]|nr:hypothetical protein C8J56DRAFT_1029922 [Mycena floridula]
MSNRPWPVWHLTGEEQFNGKGFLKFQKQLLNQAYPVGLIQYFDGTVTVPSTVASARAARTSVMVAVATAAAAATTAATPTTWFSNTPNDSEYIERDATAASMIRLSCADPDAMGLPGIDSTATQLYSFLTTKYIGQSELAKAVASRELHAIRLEQNEDYPTHEELLEKKWKVALAAGCDIKDAEFRSILIDSLPEQYDGCVDTLGNIFIVAEVEAKLHSHWEIRVKPRIDASNVSSSTASTLQAMQATILALEAKINNSKCPRCTNPNCKPPETHTLAKCFWPGGGQAGQ